MRAAKPTPLGHLEGVLPAATKGTRRRNVTIRMEEDLLNRLIDAAEAEHRSLSQEIEHRCAGSFDYSAITRILPLGHYEILSVSSEGASLVSGTGPITMTARIYVRPIEAAPHQLETAAAPRAGDQP
jgi:hypothetical protein